MYQVRRSALMFWLFVAGGILGSINIRLFLIGSMAIFILWWLVYDEESYCRSRKSVLNVKNKHSF